MSYVRTIKQLMQISRLVDYNNNGYLYIENGKLSLKEIKNQNVNESFRKNTILYLVNEYHYKFYSWSNITKNNKFFYIKQAYYFFWMILVFLSIFFVFFKQTNMYWLSIPFLILFAMYAAIEAESRKLLIKEVKEIDSSCENRSDAELIWLEHYFGCSSKFTSKIELLESYQRVFKTYKTDIDLRPSVLKLTNSKSLIPIISATVSIIATFIAKLDFSLSIEEVFSSDNLSNLLSFIPLFFFTALSIYFLIYSFLFITKLGIHMIAIFINNLDGHKSRSQLRTNQLIIALQRHTTIIVKNE